MYYRDMVTGISSSLAGLCAFGRKLSVAAGNVANVNTDGYKKTVTAINEDRFGLPQVDTTKSNEPGALIPVQGRLVESSNVDLSEEFPQMMVAQRGYEANIKALETEEKLRKSLMDILA